jgi:hypothetical protein
MATSYEMNREKKIQSVKEWQQKNREAYIAYQAEYYQTKKQDVEWMNHRKKVIKESQQRYYQKKKSEREQNSMIKKQMKKEKAQIRDTEKRKKKLLIELLNKIKRIEVFQPAPYKVNKNGNFILDW